MFTGMDTEALEILAAEVAQMTTECSFIVTIEASETLKVDIRSGWG